MQFFFKKELLTADQSDADFLAEVSVLIESSINGKTENEVLQSADRLSIQRDVNDAEHAVVFTLPNLYNGDADFLHRVRAIHQRGSVILSDTELVRAAPTSLADNDSDGLPDVWESQNGLQPTNAFGTHGGEGDYDGDGLTNFEEYLFGLSPRIPDSQLAPKTSVSIANNGDFELRFDALQGRNHQVEWSENLDDWFPLGGNMTVPSSAEVMMIDAGDGASRTHPSAVPARYYRVIYSLSF